MNVTDAKIYQFAPQTGVDQWGIDVKTVGKRQITGCPQSLKATEYRFLYIRRISFREKTIDSAKGIIHFLFPGDVHPDIKKSQDEYQECWVGFKGLLADRIVAEFNLYDKTSIIHTEVDKNLYELFQRVIAVSEEQPGDLNQLLVGILMQMLGLMNYQQSMDFNKFVQEDLNNKISEAKQMMHKHVSDNISGKQVADQIGMGYDNFRRLFKKITGISPVQYMQNIRIDKAKNMLLHSTASVKEISYSLNFENPCYFSKTFKKREGFSPAEYRYSVRKAI